MTGKTNWEILSFARFVLAFVVMISHLEKYSEIGYLKLITYLGFFEAVFGFLLISGLSIGKSIAKNKKSYFKRRIQRIYPVYIICIFLQIIVVGIHPDFQSVFMILLNLIFLNQLFTSTSFIGIAWTLALEVWLYTLAPLFLKCKKNTLYNIIYLSFFCYILYTCGRTFFHWNYYSDTKYGVNLILLAFIWLAGFGLAIFPDNKKHGSIVIAALLCGHLALTIGIQILFRIKHHQVSEIINSDIAFFIGTTCCLAFVYVVVVFNHKISPFRTSNKKILNLLGNISYPLYLSHTTTFKILTKAHIRNSSLMILSALIVSFLIYYIFDFYSKKRVIN